MVLFLDIDGVITQAEPPLSQDEEDLAQSGLLVQEPKTLAHDIDGECAEFISQICAQFSLQIVVTSDRRLFKSLEDFSLAFVANGMPKPIDVTPIIKWGDRQSGLTLLDWAREEEIKEYISQNKISDFLILDDLNLNLNNFFLIDPIDGVVGRKEDILNFLNQYEYCPRNL